MLLLLLNHAWIQKFCQTKPNLTNLTLIYFLDEWSEESKYLLKRTIISPKAKRWRGDNYPQWNAGLVAFDFPGNFDQYC